MLQTISTTQFNLIFNPESYSSTEQTDKENNPLELSNDILMTALELSEASVKAGDYVSNEEVEDFVAKRMG